MLKQRGCLLPFCIFIIIISKNKAKANVAEKEAGLPSARDDLKGKR